MDINEIITLILQSVLVPLLIYGLTLLRNYLVTKTKAIQVQRALEQATDAAIKAVSETSQSFVDGIKGTPKWNAAAMRDAFDKSMETALAILGEEGLLLLQSATGDVETYLRSAIEDAVRRGKTVTQ